MQTLVDAEAGGTAEAPVHVRNMESRAPGRKKSGSFKHGSIKRTTSGSLKVSCTYNNFIQYHLVLTSRGAYHSPCKTNVSLLRQGKDIVFAQCISYRCCSMCSYKYESIRTQQMKKMKASPLEKERKDKSRNKRHIKIKGSDKNIHLNCNISENN